MSQDLFRVTLEPSPEPDAPGRGRGAGGALPVRVVELSLPLSLDPHEFDRLNEHLLKTLGEHAADRWVMDLTRALYMGSAVLGLMVNIRQVIKTGGGKLVLCGLSDRLVQVFQTSCLVRLFVIARTRSDAVRIVGR
jgi:anti-anti-sigma factor